MKCPACNAEIDSSAVYCPKCGERVDAGEADSGETTPEVKGDERASDSDESRTVAERIQQSVQSRQGAADVEEELWAGRYCGKTMMGTWIICALVTVVLVALGVWVSTNDWLSSAILWGIVAVVLLIAWGYPLALLTYRRMSIRYRLTSQRFFHEEGVLRHTTDRIEVIDMDDITFDQTILQRLCNVGTIHISSSDRTHPILDVIGVSDVKNVATLMDDARRAERIRRGVHIEAV